MAQAKEAGPDTLGSSGTEAGHETRAPAIGLVCHGCGYAVPIDASRPFRCPNGQTDDNVDHSLRRIFDPETFGAWGDARQVFLDPEPHPFRRYRALLYSFQVSVARGLDPAVYDAIVERLDRAVREVDGRGFHVTPFGPAPRLAGALGLDPGALWIKDETGNVSGTHKARHLMGIMIWLEIARRLGLEQGEGPGPPLAIASCGNAALAAAEMARAAGRELDVFVPPNANSRVVTQLVDLGARLKTCPRRDDDPPGDPCFTRFLEAWKHGALPFTVQGKRNGLTIEGGCTLAWEIVSTFLSRGGSIDHLVIQVGGGALATSCIEALRDAKALGLLEELPRIHTVQTRAAFPLRRAYERVAAKLLSDPPPPEPADEWLGDPVADDRRARRIREMASGERLRQALRDAVTHRDRYMWPWGNAPRSIAAGILDDETYDWPAVIEGMMTTGGIPLVVSEETLAEAHRLGHEHTPIRAEPTGTAGLAGLLELQRSGLMDDGETVAVLFTGVER